MDGGTPTLTFASVSAPLGALAAAALSAAPVTLAGSGDLSRGTPPALSFPSGAEVTGEAGVLRYLARAGPSSASLLGADALLSTQVDSWVDWVAGGRLAAGAAFAKTAEALSSYLDTRSFVVGWGLTAADLAVWGALEHNRMWDALRKKPIVASLNRWHETVAANPTVKAVLAAHKVVPKAVAAKQAGGKGEGKAKGAEEGGSYEIDLPGAQQGKVCTRFPPEPSGTMHLGHTKAALLNHHFARHYNGKMIVRFDDTNPDKENQDFVDAILDDLKRLSIEYDQLTYTSDSFDAILATGDKMIAEGTMYIDDTAVDQMRQERMDGVESKNRGNSVEKNREMWEEMKKGTEAGLKCAARFKMDMQNDNKALRDPVAFRCNLTPHHRTGAKYKLYPTYDCACPFVDAHEGVTHALRTSEYKDREAQYHWVQKLMGVRKVHIWDFSRMNFVNTTLSKRKLQWFVDNGYVPGWDDPRFPTVQGILRRGMLPEALKEFVMLQGASRNMNLLEWEKIWSINKRMIDPVCPRHTAVLKETRVPFKLSNVGEPEVTVVPRHKKYPPAGNKVTTRMADVWLDLEDCMLVKEGEEVTLMDWGNAFVKRIERDAAGTPVSLHGELNPGGDVKKTKLKLHWLPQLADEELVPLELNWFEHLLTKKKLEEEDKIEDFATKDSRHVKVAMGDPNMRLLQKGDVLQLERVGYFIVDEALTNPGKPVVLFNIPDGLTKEKKLTADTKK